MSPVLPDNEARILCEKLKKEIDESSFSRSFFSGSDTGKQFGVLIATDGTVYRSFSGSIGGHYIADGFVPPVFDTTMVKETVDYYCSILSSKKDREEKRRVSRECWEKLKEMYSFHCWDGSVYTLSEIFPDAPAGSGDCCTVKLLNQCYKDGKKPFQMAEFFYGNGRTYSHGEYCTPCDSRCKMLLKYIIGLDIVYLDSDIVVVNKPSGLLAIEGRGPDKQDCVASRVRNLYNCINQPCIHRLDQATSGLMVLGLTKKAHDRLSLDFEQRNIEKEYEALVNGFVKEHDGIFTTFQRLDTENRPLQIKDEINGKEAVTYYRKLGYSKKTDVTRLSLIPKTGRTHQLRLACSLMGHSILNDPLYGMPGNGRLMLQARCLSFRHPSTGVTMSFTIPCDF